MRREWRHFIIPAIISAVLSVIWDLVVALKITPPPGYVSTSAVDQTVTGQILIIMASDVGLTVVTFGLYMILVLGRDKDRPARPPISWKATMRLQFAWLAASTVLVLAAAGIGTVALEGQTDPSLVVPASALRAGAVHHPLVIQVIAQQWQFTYRYPQYGGFETQELRLPTDRLIQFDVTSLDVTHQFWAQQLGIKLDANAGENNVGYVYVTKPTVVDVVCGELCGLWHSYMTNIGSQAGRALSPSAFSDWLDYARRTYGPGAKYLPKFALVYYPQPLFYGS